MKNNVQQHKRLLKRWALMCGCGPGLWREWPQMGQSDPLTSQLPHGAPSIFLSDRFTAPASPISSPEKREISIWVKECLVWVYAQCSYSHWMRVCVWIICFEVKVQREDSRPGASVCVCVLTHICACACESTYVHVASSCLWSFAHVCDLIIFVSI